MKSMHVLLATALICALSNVAQAQGTNLHWGMSPVEVQALVPGTRTVSGESLSGKQLGSQGYQQFGRSRLRARYFYDEAGLALVELKGPGGRRCSAFVRAIGATFGEPLRTSNQIILQLAIWHDEPLDRRVRLMTSPAGFCDLYFEPLSEYRDIDLASGPIP